MHGASDMRKSSPPRTNSHPGAKAPAPSRNFRIGSDKTIVLELPLVERLRFIAPGHHTLLGLVRTSVSPLSMTGVVGQQCPTGRLAKDPSKGAHPHQPAATRVVAHTSDCRCGLGRLESNSRGGTVPRELDPSATLCLGSMRQSTALCRVGPFGPPWPL